MSIVVISGGQTGVDQAALRAARAYGLKTWGMVPTGWQTEDGPAPWLADYGLIEYGTGYPPRTRKNVEASNHVLWIGNPGSPGGRLTLGHAQRNDIPATAVDIDRLSPSDVVRLLLPNPFPEDIFLLIAGNRESSSPGIGMKAEAWLVQLFRELDLMRGTT